jgi:class 3 adenylate cyclase
MEPQIQYCTAADGTRIAFSVRDGGDKTPLFFAPAPPFTDLREARLRWGTFPHDEDSFEPNWGERQVCLMDFRGCGLSERMPEDLSLDALCSDVEAVADRLGWAKFALHGAGMSGPVAVQYTARHPERVTRLILRDTYLRASDMGRIPSMRALGAVLRVDWESYCNLLALLVFGWHYADASRKFSEWLSQTSTQGEVLALASATASYDVTPLIDQIRVPTLVANPDFMPVPSADMARTMVSMIDNARLTLYGQSDEVMLFQTMAEFIAEGDQEKSEPSLPSGTAIILFADIVDSTSLTESMGDAAFREKARDLDEALRSIIRSADGTPVEGKLLGDGVLSVFTSAKDAINAALRFGQAGQSVGLGLHVGMHAGDVIQEDGNVFGGAVNIAARISGESEAGEVLVSDTVRSLAKTSAGVSFDDRGEHTLKGIEEPQRLFAVKEGD